MSPESLFLCVRLLLLLAVANMTPIGVQRLLGPRWRWPLDGGLRFFDGQPLLGPSKTWRGLACAVLACAAVAPLLGLPPRTGMAVGGLSLAGDALASFVKRRLRLAPGSRATGLDQVPEALLPMVGLMPRLPLTWADVLLVVVTFLVLEIPLARWAWRHGLRRDPH